MESRSHALMAGFFTIALASLAIMFALWLNKDRIVRTPYMIQTKLAVTGLNVQAAVRYKGIKVGNVTDVDFDENEPGQILLKLEIQPDTPVTAYTFATLGYQGVTGIAFIQLDEDPKQTISIRQDQAGLQVIPLRPGLMQNLEQRGLALLSQTEELGRRLNSLLDTENRSKMIGAVDKLGQAASAWQTIPGKLEPVLNTLPGLVSQTQESLNAFKNLSTDAGKLTQSLNRLSDGLQAKNGTLAKINQATDELSQSIRQETLPEINALSREAKSSMRSLKITADTLSEHPQSLLFGNPAIAPGPGEAGFTPPK